MSQPITVLDRGMQRLILQTLAGSYPGPMQRAELLQATSESDSQKLDANLSYLEQHGLVEVGWVRAMGTPGKHAFGATIHARGLDFLADDGGLGAILGTVTIKFHEDTLRALIESRIASSDLAPADKRRWTDALRELPADAIKHLSTKLIDLALDKAPGALQLLAKAIGLG